ncbi:ABC transporter permease [Salinicola avicenniae]|uniref:ABC transporter permease n=1 Tax=Salinicola avicenniae TaxID=2916836 RepID=UPI0020746B91|nr:MULTISPECIES: ABC transporter permease [unclassified Salinicola]
MATDTLMPAPQAPGQQAARSSWRVACSVWFATFMREAISRTMADRMGWFWMIFEPLAIIAIMVSVRGLFMSGSHVSGADYVAWMVVGMMGFTLFRENMMRSIGAIEANRGLFAYRQVKPVDPVLVRCFLEGMLKSLIFLLFIVIGSLLKFELIPDHPFGVLLDWLSLWALGCGVGLTLSVAADLVPEIGKIARIMGLPLLLLSGVIIPAVYVPHQFRQYLLWNPIVHGLESMRLSFFGGYHTIDGIDMTYLWFWALGSITLGLALHMRFHDKLKAH